MIRLVIAEDTYLVREGLRRLLEPEADIEVVAACLNRKTKFVERSLTGPNGQLDANGNYRPPAVPKD